MTVHQINPLADRRWPEFLQAHPKASIFHTPEWLETLRRTYKYEPFVLTTSAPGATLTNGVAFCRVKSWLTGERLVSVPFADHCDPLFEREEDLHAILATAGRGKRGGSKPVEIRPLDSPALGMTANDGLFEGRTFRIHLLDLKPSIDELLRSFDKNSVQRRIKRVAKENLLYEVGNSPALLKKFYDLQILTRRRHQVPPQPIAWFENLLQSLGEMAKVRVVSKDGVPIASILTLHFKQSVIYKYGCSDSRYNNLAGTPFLFWEAIREAKQSGALVFDMGRSDLDNPGLLNFKSNWATADLPLTYWRRPAPAARRGGAWEKGRQAGGFVLSYLPDKVLIFLGAALYKHAG